MKAGQIRHYTTGLLARGKTKPVVINIKDGIVGAKEDITENENRHIGNINAHEARDALVLNFEDVVRSLQGEGAFDRFAAAIHFTGECDSNIGHRGNCSTIDSPLTKKVLFGSNEIINLVFTVSGVSSFLEVNGLLFITSPWWVQLEGPQKFVRTFEMLSDGVNLMDEIFNTDDPLVLELLLDETIVGDRDSLSSDLEEPAFVDEMLDSLQVRGSVSHVGFHQLQHLTDGTIQSNKNGIVDLSQTEELQNLSSFRVNAVNTSDTDNNSESGFRLSEEVPASSGLSTKTNQRPFLFSVLFGVVSGPFKDDLSFFNLFLMKNAGATDFRLLS